MRLFWYPTSGKIKRRIVSKIRTSYMFSRTDISLWMLSTGLTFNIITHHQCQLNATVTVKNLSLTTLSRCNYEICYRIAFAAHFPLLMLNTVVKSSSLPFLTFKMSFFQCWLCNKTLTSHSESTVTLKQSFNYGVFTSTRGLNCLTS